PRAVYAALLDEEKYLCLWLTMYRIMSRSRQVCERRNQRCYPHYEKPQLVATAPNQLWRWDITRLMGPSKGVYYLLYVIIDVSSRYIAYFDDDESRFRRKVKVAFQCAETRSLILQPFTFVKRGILFFVESSP
ncbi:MAG: hypothetical protein ACOYLN_15940, partial [Blastocatellia bacterium]